MRARRLIAAVVLTAAAFSSTVAGLAITGTLDNNAFAASLPQCNPKPVSGPVSGPAQNPGQQGQNPGQKGQNAQCQPPSTTVIIPASGATLDPAQGYELAAVASPGATGVTFVEIAIGTVFTFGPATQDLSGTWVFDVPASTPSCLFPQIGCGSFTSPGTVWSVATYPGGVSVTSPVVDVSYVVHCPTPDCE
jgi:hypothetical protein